MNEPQVRLRPLFCDPSQDAVATVMLKQGTAVMEQPTTGGARVICLQDAGMSLAALLQAASAVGWLIQGVRKIGDHVFIEHVAL